MGILSGHLSLSLVLFWVRDATAEEIKGDSLKAAAARSE